MRIPRAATAALATVALAGCSSGHPGGPHATARTSSVRRPPPAPADVHLHLFQAVDQTIAVHPRHVLSSTTLTGPKARHVQTVDGHLGDRPGSYSTSLVTDGVHAEARMIGADAWLDSGSPQITKLMPAGKSWLRLSSSRLAAAGVPTAADQLALVYALRGANSERDLGGEDAEGVSARHFTTRIDLDRAVCATPAQWRSDVRQLFTPKSGRTPPATADVWIDAFRLVRRLRLVIDLENGRNATYELRLPGDNAPAAVASPPAQATAAADDVPALARTLPRTPAPPPGCDSS